MQPTLHDMTSVGFKRYSYAFQSQWEVISGGDVGLKDALNGMRGQNVQLDEPSIGPRDKLPSALQCSFFHPSLCWADMLFQSDLLHHLLVSEDLRRPVRAPS